MYFSNRGISFCRINTGYRTNKIKYPHRDDLREWYRIMVKQSSNSTDPLATIRRAILSISFPLGILHFVLPVYGKQIGADAVQIGLFFSVFSLMTVLLRPMVGWGVDRYGRCPFFLFGLFGYAFTMVVFAFSIQVWAIALVRTFQGIASAFLWLSANAIVADKAGFDARGRSFGIVDQSANQGAILGTFIGFTLLFFYLGGAWLEHLLLGCLVGCPGAGLCRRRSS
jgi:MFS family permease